MKLIIVVSSHLTSVESVKYLNLMFESVIDSARERENIELKFVIGMTSDDEKLLELIKLPENSKLLYNSGIRRRQFENLEVVYKYLQETEKDKEVKLMLMDDDDIMLELPEYIYEMNIFSGVHIVIEDNKDPDLHSYGRKRLLESLEIEVDKVLYEDYSGYTMLLKDFENYFNNRLNLSVSKSLEDVRFMEYIDNICDKKKENREGFIFHRLKSNVSFWGELVQDLLNMKNDLNELGYIKKQKEEV